jgi:hypothetical protein|tara:strand:+ start:416 stop:688 length:273 start_codon:yes stop_codon:yes gene_type:complete
MKKDRYGYLEPQTIEEFLEAMEAEKNDPETIGVKLTREWGINMSHRILDLEADMLGLAQGVTNFQWRATESFNSLEEQLLLIQGEPRPSS